MTPQQDKRRADREARELARWDRQWWTDLLEMFGHRCAWCGLKRGEWVQIPGRWTGLLTRDHVIPLSLGGDPSVRNVVPSCADCNSRRGSCHPFDWMLARGLRWRACTVALLQVYLEHDATAWPDPPVTRDGWSRASTPIGWRP